MDKGVLENDNESGEMGSGEDSKEKEINLRKKEIALGIFLFGVLGISWIFGTIYGSNHCQCEITQQITYNVSTWVINGSGLSFNFS